MWSGPRNISTALMRSWGNRPDTFVCDEPLYAHYLLKTGLDHPGAAEVIANQENNWRRVVSWLTGPIPEGRGIFYQKHMTHHLLPEIDREWLGRVSNAFLIREPREMIVSLAKVIRRPTLRDTGLPQQVKIFDWVQARTGKIPPVIDSRDVLESPRAVLAALCDAVGVEFREEMLAWPPGPRATDGIWAKHWYANVEKSTSFEPYRPKNDPVPDELAELADHCDSLYQTLYRHRLTA
jgi:hypothetical protein